MDFKYIEQLLARYFEAETTTQEEQILREFFAQEDLPQQFRTWQPLFRSQKALNEAHLTDDFDKRLLERAGEVHVQARKITMSRRMRPLFKAAAFVAFAIVLGTAVEQVSNTHHETGAPQQTAQTGEDELDATETTVINVQSANAEEIADTTAIKY